MGADDAERLRELYREAREASAQLDALVGSAPAILWRWDVQRRCTYVSDAWETLLRRPSEEALGAGWSDSVHPDDREMFVARCETAMLAGEPFSLEYRLRRADGTYVTVHDQGRPTDDAAPGSFVGAALDVSRAHLRRVRAERLESLARALAASRSVDEIADAVLEHALPALDAPHGAVGLPTRDGTSLSLVRQRGFETKREAWRELPLDTPSPPARAFLDGRALHLADTDEVLHLFPEMEGSLLPYRARVALPLIGRDGPVGVLYAAFDDAMDFDEDAVRYHASVAEIAASAIERAMLAEARERAAAETAILLEVTTALTAATSADDVRGIAATAARDSVDGDASLIGIIEPGATTLDYGTVSSYPSELVPYLPISLEPGSSPAADAIVEGRSSRWDTSEEIAAAYPGLHDLLERLPYRSRTFVPIAGISGPLGIMVVSSSRPGNFVERETRLLEAIGRQCGQALERLFLLGAEARARHELERTLSRLSRLTAVTAALSMAVEADDVAQIVLDATCEALGGNGGVVMLAEHDVLRPAAVTGIARGTPYGDTPTFNPATRYSVVDAYRTGHVVWIPTAREWHQRYPDGAAIFAGLAKAVIAIPFVIEDRTLGAMGIYFSKERSLQRAERRLARTIGEQGAQAFERARLYEAERRRGEQAVRLQRVSMALAVSSTIEEVAQVLASVGAEVVGAQGALVAVRGDDARVRIVAAAGLPAPVIEAFADTADDEGLPANDAIRSRLPSFLETPAEIRSRYPNLEPEGPLLREQAWATLPFLVDGSAIGAIHFSYATPQSFGIERIGELVVLTGEAAQAMHRAREYGREREVSLILQESLLPNEPDLVGTAKVVSRYWAGADHIEVGGDWWDLMELPSGKLAMAIGDVVGRGLHAATAMGQLRNALRALALEGRGPAATLESLDRFTTSTPGTELATVVYGELDHRNGEFRFACAGHPPPIVMTDGRSRALETGRSPMLGTGWVGRREEAAIRFAPGSVIVLYTDGLVERRGETFDVGIDRLRRALEASAGGDLASISGSITQRVLEPGDRSDDAAFIVVEVGPIAPSFERSIRSDPGELAGLRADLSAWLAGHGVATADVDAAMVSVSEAAANAIEHGYRDTSGMVEVRADLIGEEMYLSVADTGSWRAVPSSDGRGRGVMLMRGLMDMVDIRRAESGTTVAMRRAVERVAREAASR